MVSVGLGGRLSLTSDRPRNNLRGGFPLTESEMTVDHM